MKSALLRWTLRTVGALVLIAAAGLLWVYLASEAHLKSFPRPPAFAQAIPTDAEALARGSHLVLTRGCRGCHGADLGGELNWGFALAPNLTRLARDVSAADFEAALRHGIAHDGRAMYSMPSFNFLRLRDADVADIIAYLRSAPVVERKLPPASLPWSIRFDIARGKDFAIAAILDRVPEMKLTGDSPLARGEYIAMTTCNECHGLTLRADSPFDDETAPDLIVIAGYDQAAFTTLMRIGKAIGNRELELMSGVARGRFANFTDEEVQDLYAFLRSLVANRLEERAGAAP